MSVKIDSRDLSTIVTALRFTREARERKLTTIDEDHDEWPDLQEDIQALRDAEAKIVQWYRAGYGDAVTL